MLLLKHFMKLSKFSIVGKLLPNGASLNDFSLKENK